VRKRLLGGADGQFHVVLHAEHRANAPFLPDQTLPLAVAVAAFTAGSAYVNHDDAAGRIEVGRRADLTVLDRNLFDPAAGYPADAQVRFTIAAGQLVHQA
jgi:predicted amidohydrolase YtcJ